MASIGLFYTDEQLTSGDLQNGFSLLSSSMSTQVTQLLYSASFVILNGLTPAQSSTADNGIQIAAGLAYQNGDPILLSSQQGVNVLPGSYPNGTGLAADSTYSRIDVVYVQYATTQTNQQTRTFNPPNQSPYTQSVYTEQVDGYTLAVVHGTASASPVVPSIPAGAVALAQVTVPANATTITSADIADQTAQYRNDGGRLALATNGLLTYLSATSLGTPSGFKLNIGGTDYLQDNTTTKKLDISGGVNGVNAKTAWTFSLSGTPVVLQPDTDAPTGTHVWSLKSEAGTEYAYVDNTGLFSGSFSGDGSKLTNLPQQTTGNATTTSPGLVEISDAPTSGAPVAVTTTNANYQNIATGKYVSSINNLTGAVTNIATTGANTFTQAQVFQSNVTVQGDSSLRRYNMSATGADSNDIYATVTYTRSDGTKYLVSVLSGTVDSNGNYPTMTNTFYKTDGATVDHADTWSLTYDATGKLTGRTVSTA